MFLTTAHITVLDVLEAGACWDGVKAWVEKNRLIAGDIGQLPKEAVGVVSYGYGNGNGNGYGYGDSYGYGDGDGDGDGYGYGEGDGEG